MKKMRKRLRNKRKNVPRGKRGNNYDIEIGKTITEIDSISEFHPQSHNSVREDIQACMNVDLPSK